MPLRRLLPLLSCPLCAVDRGNAPFPLLRNPFTLHCGHTVCFSHLKTPDPTQRCPLPVCSSTPNPNAARPNIPSSSRVIYLPAAPPPASARQPTSASADQFDQRVDITISKLIEVVSRHSRPSPPLSNHGDSDLSEGEGRQSHLPERPPPPTNLPSSDEETEFPVGRDLGRSSGHRRRRRPVPESTSQPTIPNRSESALASTNSTGRISGDLVDALPPSSGHAGRPCPPSPGTAGGEDSDGSDLGTEPPKKRPRRDSRPLVTDRETQSQSIEPEAETGNSDGPNHADVNIPGPSRSDAEPRRDSEGGSGENLQTRVEKELLTELSCDICYTIYYQPVTTPCQHVSRLLFVFVPSRFLLFSSPPELLWYRTDATPLPRCSEPNAGSGTFGFVIIHVPVPQELSHLTTFSGRHSAGGASKDLWITGVTVLSVGRTCLTMYPYKTTLRTRSFWP